MNALFNRPSVHQSVQTIAADPRLRRVFESPVPAVVLFPVSHAVAFSVIRALRDQSIPILAVDFKEQAAGLYSRNVTSLLLPNFYRSETEFVAGMMAIGRCFRERPVLFFVDDDDLILSLKTQEDFERYYRLPLSPWPIVESVMNKGRLYRICQERGYPIPDTWFASSLDDVDRQKNNLKFPCIIKPTYSTRFRQAFGVKARRFDDFPALRKFARRVIEAGIEFVIQEFIAGAADSLYTYAAYSNDEGRVIGGFTGRKLHQFPPDFGTCRLAESVNDPELERAGRELIGILRYRGISLIEYKRDPVGRFRLIEINPRPGDWPESLAQECGANIVWMAYRAATDRPVDPAIGRGVGVKWANLAEDFYYCVRGYRLLGYPTAHRGFFGWLKDIRGLHAEAFFSWRDPVPAWVRLKGMCREFAERERRLVRSL